MKGTPFRDAIAFALERAGMVLTSARDGGEALIAWRRYAPDNAGADDYVTKPLAARTCGTGQDHPETRRNGFASPGRPAGPSATVQNRLQIQ